MYLLALILHQYHRAQEDETLALVKEMLSEPYGFFDIYWASTVAVKRKTSILTLVIEISIVRPLSIRS